MAYTDIDKPSDYFNTKLYTGNGATNRSITGVGFQPDLTWIKARSDTTWHHLFDAVRGANKALNSNVSNAEGTVATFPSFDSDGFTVNGASSGNLNINNQTNASWNWKKTADAGFDIVSYSGNNGTNRQISHSLSAKPDMMIVKCRQSGLWKIYHSSLGATKYLVLNDTAGVVDSNSTWNDTEPTSSNFTLGDDGNVNETGETYINYLFAEKQGYSKFGSYTGNGNANGAFVYTGFKPAWVMVKRTDGGANYWEIRDNKREPNNAMYFRLFPNTNSAESQDANEKIDYLSNGFKLRNTTTGSNGSGNSYIYMAFAEAPLVGTNNVPCTAR